MIYYINKIVGWMLSPLGFFFLGFGIVLAMRVYSTWLVKRGLPCARRFGVVANYLIGFLVVFMWVMSCGITTRIIGKSLELPWEVKGRPHGDIRGLPKADAIVVLGGGMGVHPECGSPEMFGAADRVWHGARLYKAEKAKLVTLSGSDVENSTVPLLEDFGVPHNQIILFSDARNTEEEAKLIYQKLSQDCDGNAPKILLVTSAWHMSRAKLLFERAGFTVVPAPTDFEMSYILEGPIVMADFFPSPDALSRNSYCIKEWVGNIGYLLIR